MLEDGLVSLDGNRHGALRDGGFELSLVVLRDVGVAGDKGVVLALLLQVALAVGGFVLVVRLEIEAAVVLDVLHRLVHGSSLASLVAVLAAGAVNELLLREGDQIVAGDFPCPFNGPRC